MMTNTITWIPIAEQLPDSDTTVLIFPDADGEVRMGWLDGEEWRYADGMPANPTHWAEMPGGPTA